MDDDLYQQIAELLDKHEYRFGVDTNCVCGVPGIWFWDDYCRHLAEAVGDLLIDLAGTGQLLASIDRIGRAKRDPIK